MDPTSGAREQRFVTLYADHFDPLLGFALRRADRPEDAADVVADTFLVAWRRLDDVPAGHEARPWLYGVARRVLANQRRSDGRRERLGERLREELAHVVPDAAERVVADDAVSSALATLGETDREIVALTVHEGLRPREIAAVVGLSSLAVRTRLTRARARLRALTGHDLGGPAGQGRRGEPGNDPPDRGHVPGNRPTLATEEGR